MLRINEMFGIIVQWAGTDIPKARVIDGKDRRGESTPLILSPSHRLVLLDALMSFQDDDVPDGRGSDVSQVMRNNFRPDEAASRVLARNVVIVPWLRR